MVTEPDTGRASVRARRATHPDRPTPAAGQTTPEVQPAPSRATVAVEDVLLEAVRGRRRVFFRTQPGNAGDALINAGFYALAARLGVRYEEVRGDCFETPGGGADDLLILTGGGSLSEHWDIGAAWLAAFTQTDIPLLIMPCSLLGNADALRRLRPQDTLLLRDAYSYDFAASLGLRCRLALTDDLAFLADPAEVRRRAERVRLPRSTDDLRREVAFVQHRLSGLRGHTLGAWRADAEARGSTEGLQRRYDISKLADYGALNRADSLYSARRLLEVAGWYRAVETDRLHMGVACLLMGTPVTLYANDYHKVRGVYEQSIAPYPQRRALVHFATDKPGEVGA